MKHICTAPPVQEPVTLTEVCVYLKLDELELREQLLVHIKSAREIIEHICGIALISQRWTLEVTFEELIEKGLLNRRDNQRITLPKKPLQRVVEFEMNGKAHPLHCLKMIGDDQIQSERPLRYHDAIKISYEAGFGVNPEDLPAIFRQAILVKIAEDFEENLPNKGLPKWLNLLAPYRCWRL